MVSDEQIEEGRVFRMVGAAMCKEWRSKATLVRGTCRLAAFDVENVWTGSLCMYFLDNCSTHN